MIAGLIRKLAGPAEWERNNAARDAFVAETLKLDGDELRRRMRLAYPQMDEEFVELHVRGDLEHLFWRALYASRRS